MNVFLVTSPFQYLCANEAKLAYGSRNNILILIEQSSSIGRKQMDSLLQEKEWDYVLKFSRKSRTTTVPKIIKAIKKLSNGELDSLFYSEYTAWRSKLIIRNLTFKRHIFFDDGTMTYFDYYDHIEPKSAYYRPRIFQDFLLRLQGIQPIGKLEFFPNTVIFSIFSFPDCITSYKENTLSVLKKHAETAKKVFTTYDIFIGQGSIDEKNRITLEEYLTLINNAISLSDNTLLYIPHRTEAPHVTHEIKKLKGLRYHQPTFPIEVELVKRGIEPANIIGLSSTALYTLSKIYPAAKITAIEQNNLSKGDRDNRIQQYLSDYFSQIG
jgi:hypothetical protein